MNCSALAFGTEHFPLFGEAASIAKVGRWKQVRAGVGSTRYSIIEELLDVCGECENQLQRQGIVVAGNGLDVGVVAGCER